MNRIVQDERQWISEDGRSLFERDPMLAEVRSGFARVPAEAHTIKCMTLNEPDHNSDGFPPAGGPWARRPTEAVVDEVKRFRGGSVLIRVVQPPSGCALAVRRRMS